MKLVELLDIASKGYPDEYTKTFYNRRGQFKDQTGDTLAKFIVIELIETYDADAPEIDQLYEAMRVVDTAASELFAVSRALGEAVKE